ncbi:retrotransposon Gag-like protein 3 [Eulemur rufifrons]|uniref:retrotransposon Gag-like protein 3 n=1 Tax=Eulemur rufifrons TaxID=859984 RepID=UPI003742FA14
MVEDLAASYIALKLENEILQAQVQRLMEENAALQAHIPEFQKSQAAKEDEPFQKPSEAQEPQKPPEPLDLPAAWEPQEPPKMEKPQKPTEPQKIPAREPPEAQKPQEAQKLQETQKPLEPPATQEPQAQPVAHELPAAWEAQEPPDCQDAPGAQKPQNSELQDPLNAEEASECEETSAQLEFLELLAPQEPLEPQVPQEPLDPSDAQEFLEFSAPQESLEGLIVVETSAASEFQQAPSGIEAAVFPLEYPLALNGDAQKLPEFLVQLNSYVRVRGHLYPTEAALVSFVGNHFSGEAGRWFQPLLDIQSPLLEQFESFTQVLQDTFDNPENMEDANHCIHQFCPGEGPAHQYVTHFHLIAQELNWDESTLCIQFQEGLASSIRDELSLTSPATSLSDLITQCISLEEKPDPNPSGASPSEDRDGPESPPAKNQPMQAASNHPHLSEAERARRREGHLCLYCGHPGHFARDCPAKPNRAQQAGNIEARR